MDGDAVTGNVREFAVIVDPLLASLEGLIAEMTEIRTRFQWNPAADSLAMTQLADERRYAGAWRTEPVSEAFQHGGLLLVAAEDHASGMCRLLRDPAPSPFAHVPMARASLEASSIALRLLDPRIDVATRVGRYMTECLYSEAELERALPQQRAKFRGRREAILDQAAATGLKKVTAKNKPPAIGERRPGLTSAVSDLFGADADLDVGRIYYCLYSAVSHGTVFALQRSLEVADNSSAVADWMPQPRQVIAGLYVDADDVAYLIGAVTHGYLLVVERYLELMGWGNDDHTTHAHNALVLIRRAMAAAEERVAARARRAASTAT